MHFFFIWVFLFINAADIDESRLKELMYKGIVIEYRRKKVWKPKALENIGKFWWHLKKCRWNKEARASIHLSKTAKIDFFPITRNNPRRNKLIGTESNEHPQGGQEYINANVDIAFRLYIMNKMRWNFINVSQCAIFRWFDWF